MRVLLDTNIIIDYIDKRQPFVANAEKIFKLCRNKIVKCSISSQAIPDAFYILRKQLSDVDRRRLLLEVCDVCHVQGIDKVMMMSALKKSEFTDFEDCLQMECAIAFDANYIITRDIKGYQTSAVPAITPEDFLKMMSRTLM